MSNPREALTQLLTEAIAIAAETSAGINPEFDGQIVIDWHHGLPDFVAALDSLALVVPRSDIVGTEYGVEQYRHDFGWHVERAFSRDGAIAAAEREHYDDDFEGRPRTRAVERPVLPPPPWSPVPLPEDGEPQ